jgi:G3E family GTPase
MSTDTPRTPSGTTSAVTGRRKAVDRRTVDRRTEILWTLEEAGRFLTARQLHVLSAIQGSGTGGVLFASEALEEWLARLGSRYGFHDVRHAVSVTGPAADACASRHDIHMKAISPRGLRMIFHRTTGTQGAPKGLLSVVAGNSPEIRGGLVEQLLRTSPEAVILSVSVEDSHSGGHPVVQRLMTTTGPRPTAPASLGATGDPVVILRQDLVSLRRTTKNVHVVLALPEHIDVLPFLHQLWRTRIGADSLEDHYDAAPVLVGVDPAVFLADIACVHRAVRVWGGDARGERLTPAEAAARQVEAADSLVLTDASPATEEPGRAAALIRHLNARADMITLGRVAARQPASGRVLARPRLPARAREAWEARLDAVASPYPYPETHQAVSTVVWRSRRPLHPERLADALADAMLGVLRSRGCLWLASRPDAVVTWRSAGSHLEIREADRWLGGRASPAWEAASPQRRTLACWFWDDYYGERRNEIAFTGAGLDLNRIAGALDGALLTDTELSLGPEGWSDLRDPLLGDTEDL